MSREFSENDWSNFLNELEQPDSHEFFDQVEKAHNFFVNLEHQIERQISENLEIELPKGFEIGNYSVTSKIGKGGMATVYKAKRSDGVFDQEVAIKVLSGLLTEDIYTESFADERRLLAKLSHPSIARILDGGTLKNGLPYFVMELIDGQRIDDFCKEKQTSLSARLNLFLKVAQAIQNAHSNFVLHRDIKPANILITQGHEVKLLDFGIAKFLDANQEVNHSQSGTPKYQTPEQLRGNDLSPKSDIYQLGLLLYELLTDAYPFEELTESERCQAVLSANFKDPNIINPKISTELNSIVIKCLNPNDGYESVNDLINDLESLKKGFPLSTRKLTRTYELSLFFKRNRVASILTLLIIITAITAAVLSRGQTLEIRRQQQKTLAINNFLTNIFEANNPNILQGEEISVRQLLKSSEKEIPNIEDQEVKAFTQMKLGELYKQMGLWKESGPLFFSALDIFDNNSFASMTDRAYAYREVSGYYRDVSEYQKADSMIVIGIELLLNTDSQIDLAACYVDRAKVLHVLGNYETGEKSALRALEIIEKAKKSGVNNGEHTKSVEGMHISALNYLGSNIRDQSRYEEALEISKRAVKLAEDHVEENIGGLSVALNNQALAYNRLANYKKAIEVYMDKLSICKKVYGENHPNYILTLTNLGSTYYKIKDYAKSDSLSLMAYDLYLSKFGPNHNYTVTTLYNLANSKYSQGFYIEAKECFLKVLEADINNFNETHHYIAADYNSLGLVAQRQKDFTQAKTYLNKALNIYQSNFGEMHQKTSYTYSLLGTLYNDMGLKDKAISNYEKAIEINLEVLGPDHKFYKDYVSELNEIKGAIE